jgi:hypothetical protein
VARWGRRTAADRSRVGEVRGLPTGYKVEVSSGPSLPEELAAALASNDGAQLNWAGAPAELQDLYIAHVSAARSRRERQARAADTALAARLGTLSEHSRGQPQMRWWEPLLTMVPIPPFK